jgi:hypothetical protein
MPQLRRLVNGFSLQRLGFNPRLVHVRFVMEKVAAQQVFLGALWYSPANYDSTNAPGPSTLRGWYNRPI